MFTKQKATIVKGLAIWMMLLHHCFLTGRYEKYGIVFWPFSETQIVNLANFCKTCVSLFAIVSGYGLYLSYSKYVKEKENADLNSERWVITRLHKTLNGYWFIVLLAWIICMLADRFPIRAYHFEKMGIYGGLWEMTLDFCGLSNLFGANPMNGTWWYMSAAVVYIVSTPFLYHLLGKLGSLSTIGLILIIPRIGAGYPGGTHFMSFAFAFCMGMILAQKQVFETWNRYWEQRCKDIRVKVVKLVGMLLMLLFAYRLYRYLPTDKYWDIKWGLIPAIVVVFVNDYVAYIPGIKQLLAFCGKHSMNIFLVHTFIRYYYFEKFTYSMKHFLLVILVLLGISLLLSMLIEQLKRMTKFEEWVNQIFCNLTVEEL